MVDIEAPQNPPPPHVEYFATHLHVAPPSGDAQYPTLYAYDRDTGELLAIAEKAIPTTRIHLGLGS